MNNTSVSKMVDGIDTSLPEEVKAGLKQNILGLSRDLEKARENRSTNQILRNRDGSDSDPDKLRLIYGNGDAHMFTTISDMVNGNNRDFAGFGTLLDNLYAKNKKYFTIIKDYEIMPILIPQINRVLDFLVNECLSPDVQNETTFAIKYIGQESEASPIQKDIDNIKHEMKLDSLLREVYMNRYKLGREYYMVQDYTKTFDHMEKQLRRKRLNEATAGMTDYQFIEHTYSSLTTTINEVSGTIWTSVLDPKKDTALDPEKDTYTESDAGDVAISEQQARVDFSDLNIIIERSSIASRLQNAEAELLAEDFRRYSANTFFDRDGGLESTLNEDYVSTNIDNDRLERLVETLRKKELKRCTITRFDPAKVFKLKIGGKVIGYFVISDINEGTSATVNFAQSLKDQLLKSRATNLNAATQSAEEVISRELATKIINSFDANIGINRVEDVDLLHDFIRNNEIYKGNKRVTFYYEDEIFDLSRANDSILTNAVFFTKLYSTLLLNNIVTKVLRGRGRQIHTVKLGVSPNVRRYIDNAMASLAMPEHNLGTLHGSFEQVMNPFNGASDIVIPTEEDQDRYITTDYIPGQDVDMNDEFLRTLLNSIVTSFGLDSAVLDATNGNLQFARTLTMESLQIANSVKNEQQDLHDNWERLCLEVLRIMGSDNTRRAIEDNQVEVQFYEPKTLIIQNIIEDLNSAKTLAEAIADIIPEFNRDGSEQLRARFVYLVVKENTNLDFAKFEKILSEVEIVSLEDEIEEKIVELLRQYKENTVEVPFDQAREEGLGDGEGEPDDLTDEERAIVGMPDEEPDPDL